VFPQPKDTVAITGSVKAVVNGLPSRAGGSKSLDFNSNYLAFTPKGEFLRLERVSGQLVKAYPRFSGIKTAPMHIHIRSSE
jgi:hypothetical protein